MVIKDTLLEQSTINKPRDVSFRFKPTLTIHEDYDETIRSVGWQADSCFY